jgi:aspartyl-tRNA(Asn)/glutamyl-tRNA(Gln) amidotransferase subunit C
VKRPDFALPPILLLQSCNFATVTAMPTSEFDVQYVAHLARLALTLDEEKKLSSQLGQILAYIEKLKELDVSQVEPTAHAVPLVNVTRPDEIRPGLSHDEALRNAPATANGLFLVPKIVE